MNALMTDDVVCTYTGVVWASAAHHCAWRRTLTRREAERSLVLELGERNAAQQTAAEAMPVLFPLSSTPSQ